MEERRPLVSFILTYYNQPVQMLCKCIDSILTLSLTSDEREIIVVDDGSRTSPMNGLMHYGDEIIYVRQKNGGLSVARNKGIEMVIFDFTNDDSHQTAFNDKPLMSGTEYMLRYNIRGTAWGYLFRRKTLSELRFTPGIYHEDEEFTPQLLIRAEQVYVTDAKAYYYYKHPGTITTHADESSKDKRLSDIRGVLSRLHYLCDRIPPNDRLAMQRRVAQLTMDYIYQVILQKRSLQVLNDNLETLRQEGLFPLPDRDYSQKYKWFRLMLNTSIGRTMLFHTLPLLKKER